MVRCPGGGSYDCNWSPLLICSWVTWGTCVLGQNTHSECDSMSPSLREINPSERVGDFFFPWKRRGFEEDTIEGSKIMKGTMESDPWFSDTSGILPLHDRKPRG